MVNDPEHDVVARVIRAAGRRPPVPEAARLQVRAAAERALGVRLQRQRRQAVIRNGSAALAAVFALVAVGVGWWQWQSAPLLAAQSDQAIGDVTLRAAGEEWQRLPRDRQLLAGTEVRTGSGGRAGLVLVRGQSLRIDERSHVRLEDAGTVRILAGTVYIDSGRTSAQATGGVQVLTPLGATRDVGTRFEVQWRDGRQRVRVRDGLVLVTLPAGDYRAGAGEELLVTRAGSPERSQVASADPAWQWVELVARAPEIDNRPVDELLAWVARETGRPLRFASPAIEVLARTTILHGSVRNLAPLPAATTALATTDLELEILADGTLLVKERVRGDRGD